MDLFVCADSNLVSVMTHRDGYAAIRKKKIKKKSGLFSSLTCHSCPFSGLASITHAAGSS